MKKHLVYLLFVSFLGLTSCADDQLVEKKLVDDVWRLKSMTEGGESVSVPITIRGEVTMQLQKGGMVTGASGVNRFRGQAEIDPQGRVEWKSGFMTTRRGGPPELMEFERRFLAALKRVDTFTSGQELKAVGGKGPQAVELLFTQP